VIADNKLAENAGWDTQLLALELKELTLNLDFDVTLAGFELPEVDFLIGSWTARSLTPTTKSLNPTGTARGNAGRRPLADWRPFPAVWRFHEARELRSLAACARPRLFSPTRPTMCESPETSLASARKCIRNLRWRPGDDPAEFTAFLKTVFDLLAGFSVDGSLHYICMDWRHMREVLDSSGGYSELKNFCVWAKTNAGMGSLYRSQHELVFVFKHGTASTSTMWNWDASDATEPMSGPTPG